MKSKIIMILCAAVALTGLTACMDSTANSNSGNKANSPTMVSNAPKANTNSNTNATNTANMGASNADSNTGGDNPMVGGAAMMRTKDIVDNAMNSKDHTTLVAAVKAAGLVETLKGAGPFTVFAPVNAAFDKLPKGTVDTLLKPENKEKLATILKYHVVSGKQDAAAVAKAIEDGKGKATFKTVAGGSLTASMEGKDVILTDEKGGKAKVTIVDVMQSNGVIHVIDTVLMPK